MKQNQHTTQRFHHQPGTDPYRHVATREIQPQTRKDLRGLVAVLTGATALVAAGALLAPKFEDTPAVPTESPATTIEVAQEGDTLWGLQEKEGTNGHDIRDVVAEAMELNGNSAKIVPGQAVVLVDDPNTTHP
jgi:hypothetical protein